MTDTVQAHSRSRDPQTRGEPHGARLRAAVRRTLAWRLGLMTLLVAFVIAVAAYFTEREFLRQRVLEVAENEIALLTARAQDIADAGTVDMQQAFQQAVGERERVAQRRADGKFVYVLFYGLEFREYLAYQDKAYALIQPIGEFIAQTKGPASDLDQPWSETVGIAGIPHIHALVPLHDRTGQARGHARGFFAIADTAREAFRARLLRTVLVVVGIVLASGALVYPVIEHLLRRLADFSSNLLEANLETLSLLGGAIAKRDSDTVAHSYRVTLYSVRLAQALFLPNREIKSLIKGALLHDVGKIGIPDSILLKQGPLTEEEYRTMKEHVKHGLDIVARCKWLDDAAAVVGSHHENFDGTGYPHGRQGQAIPLIARIFVIADVFDALTSRRPYKEPFPYDEAVGILERGRGTRFDPGLLDAFLGIAPDLLTRYSTRTDEDLRQEFAELTDEYFYRAPETLDQ